MEFTTTSTEEPYLRDWAAMRTFVYRMNMINCYGGDWWTCYLTTICPYTQGMWGNS